VREETFRHLSQVVPGPDLLPYPGHGLEIPELRLVQGGEILAPPQEEPLVVLQFPQRVLQAVVDHAQHAGAQGGREQLAGELGVVADLQARGALEDLKIDMRAADTDDLRLQRYPIAHHIGDLVLENLSFLIHLTGDKRAIHRHNPTVCWTVHIEPPCHRYVSISKSWVIISQRE